MASEALFFERKRKCARKTYKLGRLNCYPKEFTLHTQAAR